MSRQPRSVRLPPILSNPLATCHPSARRHRRPDMKPNKLKGVAIVEFSFSMLVMIPLLLGTIGFGLRLLQQMQTVQLARDSGRMYSRPGRDMSLPGNQSILATVVADLGLKTDATGKAVLIPTTVTYIYTRMWPNHDVHANPITSPHYKPCT